MITATFVKDFKGIKNKVNDICDKYQSHLRIDQYNLQADCAEQPEMYFDAVSVYSEIYCFIQRLKLQSKNRHAVVALMIRKNPSEYGYDKVTDSIVNALIDDDDEMREIEDLLAEANGINVISKGLLDALEHRRSMLNNEVQLSLSALGSAVGNAKISSYVDDVSKGRMRKADTPQKSPFDSINTDDEKRRRVRERLEKRKGIKQ